MWIPESFPKIHRHRQGTTVVAPSKDTAPVPVVKVRVDALGMASWTGCHGKNICETENLGRYVGK